MGMLLWPRGEALTPAYMLPDRTAEDLQLGLIAEKMAINNYYKLSVADLGKLWTTEERVIAYRQQVLEDFFRNPGLEPLMEGLLDSIDTWESHGSRTSRATDEKHQALDLWDFTFLDAYIQKVDALDSALLTMDLRSEGMTAFRERIHTMAHAPRFTAVREVFARDCGGVNLPSRITIGFNLNESLKPVSLKLMKIPEKATRGRKMSLTPTAFGMTRQILGKALSEAGRSISGFVRQESSELRAVKQDIIFYLSALNLQRSWQQEGLPWCLPEIRPMAECAFRAEEMFSPLLVLHGHRGIVTNSITFAPGGELLILTGANQGGKTVFLQSTALTQWLFQLGFMVPAKQAALSPVQQILTVFAPTAASSSAEKSLGLLSEEAGRIAEAVRRLSDHCMVLFNEPLNATSPMENLYISQEVMGAFKAAGARGIWVTHLYELASDRQRVNDLIPWGSRLGSIRIQVESDGQGTHSTYHILRGEPEFKSYAAEVMKRKGI